MHNAGLIRLAAPDSAILCSRVLKVIVEMQHTAYFEETSDLRDRVTGCCRPLQLRNVTGWQ
jgi:hypothetical protein